MIHVMIKVNNSGILRQIFVIFWQNLIFFGYIARVLCIVSNIYWAMYFSDSKRSEGYILFTMMCHVCFVFLYFFLSTTIEVVKKLILV